MECSHPTMAMALMVQGHESERQGISVLWFLGCPLFQHLHSGGVGFQDCKY